MLHKNIKKLGSIGLATKLLRILSLGGIDKIRNRLVANSIEKGELGEEERSKRAKKINKSNDTIIKFSHKYRKHHTLYIFHTSGLLCNVNNNNCHSKLLNIDDISINVIYVFLLFINKSLPTLFLHFY